MLTEMRDDIVVVREGFDLELLRASSSGSRITFRVRDRPDDKWRRLSLGHTIIKL